MISELANHLWQSTLLLMALGDRLEWASRSPQIATPAVSATLAQVTRPFVVDPVVGFLSVQEAPRSLDWFALAHVVHPKPN